MKNSKRFLSCLPSFSLSLSVSLCLFSCFYLFVFWLLSFDFDFVSAFCISCCFFFFFLFLLLLLFHLLLLVVVFFHFCCGKFFGALISWQEMATWGIFRCCQVAARLVCEGINPQSCHTTGADMLPLDVVITVAPPGIDARTQINFKDANTFDLYATTPTGNCNLYLYISNCIYSCIFDCIYS